MASFDENGKYIKTNWKAGDKITATKLNKIEESIEAVNDNDISRHVETDARLDALEAKDVAHDKEFTNVKNLIEDAKDAAELGDYEINSRMQFLEQELNEGIEEVHNVASTVDGKIAQGKADMEAMVAEVEADLEGLHAKDEELSEQLERIENSNDELFINLKNIGLVSDCKYYDETTQRWYTDETMTEYATDNSEILNQIINNEIKRNNDKIVLPRGKYYIKSPIKLLGHNRIFIQGYNSSLCCDSAFDGYYMLQNFEEYNEFEDDNYIILNDIWFNCKNTNVTAICLQHFFEGSRLENLVFDGYGSSCIKLNNVNGGLIYNTIVYSTATNRWDNELTIAGGGQEVVVDKWITSPYYHNNSIFKFSNVGQMKLSNIHCEGLIDNTTNDKRAIFEITNVAGFVLENSSVLNSREGTIDYSIINCENTLLTGYEIFSPSINNLQVRYNSKINFTKDMIIDKSQNYRNFKISYKDGGDVIGRITYNSNELSYELTNTGNTKSFIWDSNFNEFRTHSNIGCGTIEEIVFLNSWVNLSSYSPSTIKTNNNFVFLSLYVGNGSIISNSNTTLFILPDGYKPKLPIPIPCTITKQNGDMENAYVYVEPTGAIQLPARSDTPTKIRIVGCFPKF